MRERKPGTRCRSVGGAATAGDNAAIGQDACGSVEPWSTKDQGTAVRGELRSRRRFVVETKPERHKLPRSVARSGNRLLYTTEAAEELSRLITGACGIL